MTDLPEGTIRIAVSLTWDDAFDTDVARRFTEQVHADRSACLQGPAPDSEGHGPDLTDTLDAVTADGARRIELVGWTGHNGPVPLSWLRRVAGQWVRDHPEGVQIVAHGEAVRPGEVLTPQWREVTGNEAPLRSTAWQDFPCFRHHLLICRGPRCSAAGAAALHSRLREKLALADALDTEVLVTVTGCMFPCNHAPLMVVWPDGKCIHLTEDNLDEVAAELSGRSHR